MFGWPLAQSCIGWLIFDPRLSHLGHHLHRLEVKFEMIYMGPKRKTAEN